MLRILQSIEGKNLDAEKVAKVKMKRGSFVTVSEKAGNFDLAADLSKVDGIVTRDFIVTQESAMGMSVSDYDLSQDTIEVGEFGGVMTLLANEMYATTEYDDSLVDAEVDADKYLTVANGKLTKSADATTIKSLGWVNDAGLHKLLAFRVLK